MASDNVIYTGGTMEIMKKKSKQLKAMSSETVKQLIETNHSIPSHIEVWAKTTEQENQQVSQALSFNEIHLDKALSDGYVQCVSESVALMTSRLSNELLQSLVMFTEKVLENNFLDKNKATSTITADYSYNAKTLEGVLGSKSPLKIKISVNLPIGKDNKKKNISGIMSFLQIALPFAEWCDSGEVLAVVRSEGIYRLDFEFYYGIQILAHNLKHSKELLSYCEDEDITQVMQSWYRQIVRLKRIADTSQRTEYRFNVQNGQLIDADDSVHTCDRVDFHRQKIGIW